MLFVQPAYYRKKLKKQKINNKKSRLSRYVCANCHTPVSDASCLLVIQGDSPITYLRILMDCSFLRFLPLVGVRIPLDGSPSVWKDTWFAGYAWTVQYCRQGTVKSTWGGATMVPQSRQDSMGLSVSDLLKWRRSRTSGSIHGDIPADVWADISRWFVD